MGEHSSVVLTRVNGRRRVAIAPLRTEAGGRPSVAVPSRQSRESAQRLGPCAEPIGDVWSALLRCWAGPASRAHGGLLDQDRVAKLVRGVAVRVELFFHAIERRGRRECAEQLVVARASL